MGAGFRASMNWLHTWAGVVVGAVLFAIFWMGTLSVFDREIDRWMMPETRLAPVAEPASLDRIREVAQALAGDAPSLFISLPTERQPVLGIGFRKDGEFVSRNVDPATATLLPERGTLGGTGFIFPFHFSLNIKLWSIGYWLVGLAAMAMLALLVSGVIVHVKIFADFFTLRTDKKAPRVALDLHNVTGVLGLPFHFMITLSGLIIFVLVYFPNAWQGTFPDRAGYFKEAFGSYSRPKANQPGDPMSLDALSAEAVRLWGGGTPLYLRLWHTGDANAVVEFRRSYEDRVTMNTDTLYLDAATGAVLSRQTQQPIMTAQRFLSGLHFIQFRHWTLRWIYFALGLSGCVLIATGFLFWLESRRKRHEKQGLKGLGVVEGLTIGATTGIILATLSFFIANKLLPPGMAERQSYEAWAFYLLWAAGFAHGWIRRGQAWAEQSWAIAAAALCAPVLNALITGDHLARSLSKGQWAVAGMDLALLALAAIAALTARKLQRRPATTSRAMPGRAQGSTRGSTREGRQHA
ncbi:PepSY-associated TM helix domain-containing protein [Oceanibaculum pacificum]|nr:PepSY-associated TM helix domain-containing protein [Oceanibaculum pacificum]